MLKMPMTADLIVAATAVATLAAAAWLLVQWRKRHDSLQRVRERRCADAWTELQQRCIAVVEKDERGGVDPEELHRAAAHYRSVIGDISVREAERQMAAPKQVLC